MSEIEGFILVGGASSRMGRDKALLDLYGQSFVERTSGALHGIAQRISTVGANKEMREALKLPDVPDIYVRWGALGGLHAALAACQAPWAAVVACDLPFVTEALFLRLASLREDYDAVVPVQDDKRVQPLCALYRADACLLQIERLIATGERRPRALLPQVRTHRVAFEELSDLEGANLFFRNINTPEDYRAAQALEEMN